MGADCAGAGSVSVSVMRQPVRPAPAGRNRDECTVTDWRLGCRRRGMPAGHTKISFSHSRPISGCGGLYAHGLLGENQTLAPFRISGQPSATTCCLVSKSWAASPPDRGRQDSHRSNVHRQAQKQVDSVNQWKFGNRVFDYQGWHARFSFRR